jgi:hypothetical protein
MHDFSPAATIGGSGNAKRANFAGGVEYSSDGSIDYEFEQRVGPRSVLKSKNKAASPVRDVLTKQEKASPSPVRDVLADADNKKGGTEEMTDEEDKK